MLGVTKSSLFFAFVAVALTACDRKPAMQEATGDVQVQVGVQTSPNEYALQKMNLLGITDLTEVAGSYAKFFYSPGAENQHLIGTAPHANFIRTGSFFVPTDLISMQMATIYYHMQNLALLDIAVGAQGVNQWPRSVGIETQMIEESGPSRNNAFYNGQTDSMMFVPFTNAELPIAMNAGIIAHEHFHSLFYKIVMRPAVESKKILLNRTSLHADERADQRTGGVIFGEPIQERNQEQTVAERAQLFNETYLRGINEGLADFWGWVYTTDPEFIRWSLPAMTESRSLSLPDNMFGYYQTNGDLNYRVSSDLAGSSNARDSLAKYAYVMATPYARFLKQMTMMQVENKGLTLNEAKVKMAQMVFAYIKVLSAEFMSLKAEQTLHTGALFNFIADQMQKEKSGLAIDGKDCEFLLKYINRELAKEKRLQICDSQTIQLPSTTKR